MSAKPKKLEAQPLRYIDPLSWGCPFCWRDNGWPERAECECGAKREGLNAVRA